MAIVGCAWTAHSAQRAAFERGPGDMLRRWRVSQYIQQRENPYATAQRVLEQEVGPIGQGKLRRKPLFHIPRPDNGGQELGVLPAVGPPEAVYPPSAQLVLTHTVGRLPQKWVLPGWTAVNLACLAVLAVVLAGQRSRPAGDAYWAAGTYCLLMVWAPAQQAIVSSQVSIQVTLALVLAARWLHTRPVVSGLLFSLALVKPSMALPFLVLPLVTKKWTTLAVIVATQLLATLATAALLREAPWRLISQWLNVSQYFTQGPYSIQSVLNRYQLDNSSLGFVAILGFAAVCAYWCWRHRSSGEELLFDFLCFASVLWTYHGPYDLIILFIPVTRMFFRMAEGLAPLDVRGQIGFVLTAILFLAISLGTWSPAYVGDGALQEAVRWTCRAALVGSLLVLAIELNWSQRPGPALSGPATK